MPPPDAVLLAALHAAPRRFRMPPLPVDADAARAGGTDGALAFAIEDARRSLQHGHSPPAPTRALFIDALADLVAQSLGPQRGDTAFQARVLQARDPLVDAHVQLLRQLPADRRALRSAVAALAHPGKLRGMEAGPMRDGLQQLHDQVAAHDWAALPATVQRLLALQPSLRPRLAELTGHPGLERLRRDAALREAPGVQRHLALLARRGPAAGSDAAAAQGRASGLAGDEAEAVTVQALLRVAQLLDRVASSACHGVARSLRPPAGFPAAADKAKDEWDAAIVRDQGSAGATIVLLAEVKAAPAAAAPDFSRLLRGLQRLAQADEDRAYSFLCADGELALAGASLRALLPHGQSLPPHVVYCCAAPAEAQPALLTAATRAVLLAEATSLAYAVRLQAGLQPAVQELAPVWDALTVATRLRSALHQYATACAAREAMVHPGDLLAAVQAEVKRVE